MESNHHFPGCHPGVFAVGPRDRSISDRGGRRTHNHEALDLAALPVCVPGPQCIKWRVRGSHPAVQAYEAQMSTGPPARLQVPVSSRAGRAYETQLGTCRTCINDEGESRTPTPHGHDSLSVACLPGSTTSSYS